MRAARPVGFEKRCSATTAHDVEVRPPQHAHDRQREHRRGERLDVELDALGADADRDDRLAQRDDHHQPEALGEVARRGRASPRRRRQHDPVVEHERGDPEQVARGAVERRGREDDQAGAGDQRRQQAGPARAAPGRRARRARTAPRAAAARRGSRGPTARRRRRTRRRASATTSIAPIAANMTSRGSTSSGSTVLVSHA